ncbi:MAG TPA: hypothetical protein VMR80_03045 [Candidatus Acidoferrum sp.]|nr:hypothetical protein [Candidatus Acidoferrum sp.]
MILLLTMALMIIFAAAIVPSIKFQIERDREEELIHRGVQYSRAIRVYYKRFGRYPAKIEDLENTNNLKFLRKRYKDPVTGQDFKLLHFGEVKLMFGGLPPGAIQPGAPGVPLGANGQNTGLGGNNQLGNAISTALVANQIAAQTPGLAVTGSDPSQTTPAGSDPNNPSPDNNANGANGGTTGTSGDGTAKTFGGMPVVGVVSVSKKETIREFNHKKKYNEWQFIYDPGTDRGGLLMTPNQPPLVQQQQNVNGQNGTNGNSNGFSNGFGNGFGNSPSGLQNNLNPPNSGFGNSNPPSNPPPQQQ